MPVRIGGEVDLAGVTRRVVGVPVRDGAYLAADLYLAPGEGPRAALLMRTPYGRRGAQTIAFAHPAWYARSGFAVLIQDSRGSGDSEGDLEPFMHEAADGSDTIEWVAAQDWCTGAVGTYGFSYPGISQLLAGTQAPPSLRAMAPAMTAPSGFEGWTYRNGALQLAFILTWALTLAKGSALRAGDLDAVEVIEAAEGRSRELLSRLPVGAALPEEVWRYAPYLRDWLDRGDYDSYWQRGSAIEGLESIAVPCLHIAGWYDIFLEGTIESFRALRDRGAAEQRLVIGPWQHMPWGRLVGECDFDSDAGSGVIDDLQLRFFDRWLRDGDEGEAGLTVQAFVMGENSWREYSDWPPAAATRTLHLRSGGRANSFGGDGELAAAPREGDPPDIYITDPANPIESVGGRSCCDARVAPMGPADQRSQERRHDLLVYDSEALDEPTLLVGTPRAILFLGTDAASIDVVVRLVRVFADGTAIPISDGVVRISGGAGAGAVQEAAVRLAPTATRFAVGEVIRLEIAGSSFPAYDRNPHTGARSTAAGRLELRVATQALYHDARNPSRLELPIVAG
jgi:hypothetical protein